MLALDDPEGKQQTLEENSGLPNFSHAVYVEISVYRAPFLLAQYDQKSVLIYTRALRPL